MFGRQRKKQEGQQRCQYINYCECENKRVYLCVLCVKRRIDANVDDAHLSIEAAHTELVKYFQSVTSNRWLMIKIFGVLIFFFIIFVILVV